jgi:hypothetical protein
MAYWGPEQPGNGTIGCAVVMNYPARPMDTKEQAFLQTAVKRGQPLAYYAGAGWTKSGDFLDKAAWVRYVSGSHAKLNAR